MQLLKLLVALPAYHLIKVTEGFIFEFGPRRQV